MSSIYVRNSFMGLAPVHKSGDNSYYEYQNTGTNDSEIGTLNLRAKD